MTACSFHETIITRRGKSPVTRQQSAALNMAKFIRSQTLHYHIKIYEPTRPM
ncbi:Rop family plasmid primer RNA-binding protein, partial [Enterobacter hormaechei]